MKKLDTISRFAILIVLSVILTAITIIIFFSNNTKILSDKILTLNNSILTANYIDRNINDEKNLDKYAKDLSDFVANVITEPLWMMNNSLVEDYINKLHNLPNIEYAVIYERHGIPIAGKITSNSEIKEYKIDLFHDSLKIGTLVIGYNKTYLNQVYNENKESKNRMAENLNNSSGKMIFSDIMSIYLVSLIFISVILLIVFFEYRYSKKVLNNANEEIKDSESKYRNIFAQAAVGISYIDLNGFFIKANKKFCDITGYSEEELLEKTFFDITSKEYISEDMANQKKLLNNIINEYKIDKRYIRKDGSKKWVKITVSLARDEANAPKHFVGIVEDIDIEKEIENELFKKEKVIEEIQDGISTTTGEKFFQTIVDKMAKLLNADLVIISIPNFDTKQIYPLAFCAKKKVSILRKQRIDEELFKDIINEKCPVYRDNLNINFTDNALVKEFNLIEFIGSPLFDSENDLVGLIAVFYSKYTDDPIFTQNIINIFSSRISAEIERSNQDTILSLLNEKYLEEKEKAETANNAKNIFLTNMSHELRTPLNGIVGLIEIMEMTPLSEQQKDFIKDIQKCSDNLLSIVNDILDISKIEAGKIEINIEKFNLKEAVINIYDNFINEFSRKKLDFNISYDNLIPDYLLGDSSKLIQILSNLISNAKKFTEKGNVVLSVERAEQLGEFLQVKFSVSDTGIGIDESIREKLFKPFEQGDISFSKKYQGTGLGLSISKRLIELMGGEIDFISEVGKGTTFYFTINLQIP